MRRGIIEAGLLEAVIVLGPNLFYGTGIPASICVFRWEGASTRDSIYFVNAQEIYTKGRAQNTLSIEQADRIHELYRNRANRPGLTRSVPLGEVGSNDHSLNISLYVQDEVDEDTPTVAEALAAFEEAMARLDEAEDHLEELLRREGLLP